MVEEDSPELERIRSALVEHIFNRKGKSRSKLIDVSVRSFAVALAQCVDVQQKEAGELAQPPPATWPLLTLVFASVKAAEAFMTPPYVKGQGAPRPAAMEQVIILKSGLGVEPGSAVYMAMEGHVDEIPDITYVLRQTEGTVVRCYLRSPSAQLLPDDSADSAARFARAKSTIEKLLTHFWQRKANPIVLLQLRQNLVAETGGSIGGAVGFVPCGLYFDIEMQELPLVYPSALAGGLGALRWLLHGIRVQDFKKQSPPWLQPRSTYQRKMENYFLNRTFQQIEEKGPSVGTPAFLLKGPRPNKYRTNTRAKSAS